MEKKEAYKRKERSDIILQPFMDLGIELCGGDKKHHQYFLNLIGHLIQYPTKKVPICVIFKGKQGTGKSMYINTIGNIKKIGSKKEGRE
jgi:pantothenate kinase-related protein Tda10